MKLQYKNQQFQEDASRAIVDVFRGQPNIVESSYMLDPIYRQMDITYDEQYGVSNYPLRDLSQKDILKNINEVQIRNDIIESKSLELTGRFLPGNSTEDTKKKPDARDVLNLTIEMETGTGKTYTYIKTIYELNKAYGWTKFIIMVPSIAIREGVYKSLQSTEDHFAAMYGKKINYKIYDSTKISEIRDFETSSNITVMIINSQAFAGGQGGKLKKRIWKELDDTNSIKPIDLIAKTNPIIIMDEPQSLSGEMTTIGLMSFNPLFILRYSATHREFFNQVYRLDSIDAYNMNLVKHIEVKGISQKGTDAQNTYIFVDDIIISKDKPPRAKLEIEQSFKNGIRPKIVTVDSGADLKVLSGDLNEYNGFKVLEIDGRDNSIEFLNGIRLEKGEYIGKVNDSLIKRIQIRETIKSHLEKERELYKEGIKVLSLFFIDEVAKYRQYDEENNKLNGEYADIFEEEYNNLISQMQLEVGDSKEYLEYLSSIEAESTHEGYFSIDKSGKMINSKENKKEGNISDDVDAYDLIMKNKELLLSFESPVRFIFTHSALKEGWDNPNVFQIATLKQSTSDVKKRQEVGRGLRLCVNQDGIRQDEDILGEDMQSINRLTVIANESYESFAKGIQDEWAATIGSRPLKVSTELFVGQVYKNADGRKENITEQQATSLLIYLAKNDYVDDDGKVTEKYKDEVKNNEFKLDPKFENLQETVEKLMDQVFDVDKLPKVEPTSNVKLEVVEDRFNSKEFDALWNEINTKTYYTVKFDNDSFINDAFNAINRNLRVSEVFINVESGRMDKIDSKAQLEAGTAFNTVNTEIHNLSTEKYLSNIKYDLIGKVVDNTGLTRNTVARILSSIDEYQFNKYKNNPEDFISQVSNLISGEIARTIIHEIVYNKLDEKYEKSEVFLERPIRGKLGDHIIEVRKHLFDYLKYDSDVEKELAGKLDSASEVLFYVKLPGVFKINTPVGTYNPDWAIVFDDINVKYIYFIAETKGSSNEKDLKEVELAKIECARRHFKEISSYNLKYDVIESYDDMLRLIR